MAKKNVSIVLVTAPKKEAEKIARTLLKERLIACANLLPAVTSLYWWEGKINRDAETLMFLKTRPANLKFLLRRLKQLHSYKVPEFLALRSDLANPDYTSWVHAESCH
jgi:periplasmic divalent cation tolerance protein